MIPFRFASKAPLAPRSGEIGLILLGLLVGAASPISSWSQDSTSVADSVMKTLETIQAKEGISIGGVFRSEYLNSSLSGPGLISDLRSDETAEFTSVDFDIHARPNTATQGHVIFRMHQDWRNFFSDISNPIFTRWLSLDGKVKSMFSYDAGEYRQRYSPLTLWAPELSVLYEPEIFQTQRQEAEDEVFLGNNDRILQGVNFNFDAGVDAPTGNSILKELHINAMGSRLRNVETDIANGDFPTDQIEESPVEKYLAATNLEAVFPKGFSLGGSAMLIFDKNSTYEYVAGADSLAQNTSILDGRAGLELAPLLGVTNWGAGISAEYAASQDRPEYFPVFGDSLSATPFAKNGSALLARVHGNAALAEAFNFSAGVDFIRNDANYHNALAQSPTFIGQRIMNIENDSAKVRTDNVSSRDYTTFDAMYRTVFKFTPELGTNLWARAPFQKLSYSNSIMTQREMAAFAASRLDTAVQLVMPFGPATPNRTGLTGDATVNVWKNRLQIKGLFASLKNVTGVAVGTNEVLPITDYSQYGGGLKLEIGSMLGLQNPLTLSGSLVQSGANNAGIAADTTYAARKVTSDFTNASLYYKFWKRAALMGGYQQIKTDITVAGAVHSSTQRNLAGGAEYKVAAGAYVDFSLGLISMDYTGYLPDQNFSQLQTDLFLHVLF